MKLYANLHSHTTHSDGIYTPTEIVRVAAKEGFHAFAVTDHDTVTGYEEAKAECDRLGLECIFGCEFSAHYPERDVMLHVTAFNFDPNYPKMRKYLDERSFCETHKTKVCFERGIADGLLSGVTWEEVLEFNKGITWLCNEHVFRLLKAKGLKCDLDYPEFFNKVYGKRRSEVKLPYEFLHVRDLIALVHEAGGIAIIAHPAKMYGSVDHLDEYIEMGIDGVEVWHSMLNDDERQKALKVALEKNLFVSGGEDHEGLCGGQYARYEDPTVTRFYIPELSAGTTKDFFDEIKANKLSSNRAEFFSELIK